MAAPQKERAPLLNRMADASPALPTRRGSEFIGKLDDEHKRIKDTFLPSSVSIGITVMDPNPSMRSTAEQFKSIGAGFVVMSDEHEAIIATARHVALAGRETRTGQALHLQIKSSEKAWDGSKREGKILTPQLEYVSNEHDVAFYSIRADDNSNIDLRQELPAAALGSAQNLQALEQVVLIGSPYSFDQTTIIGHIAHDREIPWPIRRLDGRMRSELFIQIDSDMGPGNSGGMVIDAARREIVGMSTQIGVNEQTGTIAPPTGMALPVDTIKAELENYLTQKAKGEIDPNHLQSMPKLRYSFPDLPLPLPNFQGEQESP